MYICRSAYVCVLFAPSARSLSSADGNLPRRYYILIILYTCSGRAHRTVVFWHRAFCPVIERVCAVASTLSTRPFSSCAARSFRSLHALYVSVSETLQTTNVCVDHIYTKKKSVLLQIGAVAFRPICGNIQRLPRVAHSTGV